VEKNKKRPEPSKLSNQKPIESSELACRVRESGMIFTGTVVDRGKSSVPAVPPN